jgi:8-amino-7-oxononanoate synthase
MELGLQARSSVGPAADWAADELRALERQRLRRHLEPLESPQGAVVKVAGIELINLSSNDYLGLANDPAVIDAAGSAVHRFGVGSGASRLLVGSSVAHQRLEQRLAKFGRADAAVLFNSGYAANVGILSALCGPEDAIFSDERNHASLIDGCRLSRAKVAVYAHRDVKALERLLRAISARRKLVCTESVFSMDGDRAPLAELADVSQRHGAALLVDEAHAVGVIGPTGAGLCEELVLTDSVDVRVGTLGKALGVFGAFALSSRAVSELLFNRARSLVFSTALPPALCASAEAAISRVEASPQLRASLWRNIQRFSEGLRGLGIRSRADSAIFPVVVGDAQRALSAAEQLRERGLLVKPIRPPTVPEGTSRLRFSLSSAHSDAHVDLALSALREVLSL